MSFILFLIVLTGLVLIHEAGHFLAAKWAGVKPEEFGVGFPPRAIGWTREKGKWRRIRRDEVSADRTIWSINWLPLGGFVRLKGEQGEAATEKDSFQKATFGKKFVIIAAGVVMNWLLAAVIFTIGYAVGIPTDSAMLPPQAIVRDARVEVSTLLPDGPAARAGLRLGDTIRLIQPASIPCADAFSSNCTTQWASADQGADALIRVLQARAQEEQSIVLEIERAGEVKTLSVIPEFIPELDRRGVGVAFEERVIARLPWWQAPIEGARTTFIYTVAIVQGLGGLVKNLVTSGTPGADVSGPVGIAVMTGKVAEEGIWALARFAAILSLNLAVINFLPIPALDGGRALFLLAERLRGKKLRVNLEAAIHSIGFVVLILLILLVTLKDLHQYGAGIIRSLVSLL